MPSAKQIAESLLVILARLAEGERTNDFNMRGYAGTDFRDACNHDAIKELAAAYLAQEKRLGEARELLSTQLCICGHEREAHFDGVCGCEIARDEQCPCKHFRMAFPDEKRWAARDAIIAEYGVSSFNEGAETADLLRWVRAAVDARLELEIWRPR